jgi:hypothetical protein
MYTVVEKLQSFACQLPDTSDTEMFVATSGTLESLIQGIKA